MDELRQQIARLNQENIEAKRRLDRLEDNDRRHEEDIRQIYAHQEATKAYVTQILGKLDSLETKLFNLVTQLTANQEKDRNAERNERSKTMKAWIEVLKYVLSITLGAIIVYLFSKGA